MGSGANQSNNSTAIASSLPERLLSARRTAQTLKLLVELPVQSRPLPLACDGGTGPSSFYWSDELVRSSILILGRPANQSRERVTVLSNHRKMVAGNGNSLTPALE